MKIERDDITGKFLRECFLVDEERGCLIWRERPEFHFMSPGIGGRWNKKYAGTVAGWMHSSGRYRVFIGGMQYQVHRVIYAVANNLELADLPVIIDHKNGDYFDNRPSNLRAADPSQNCMNTLTPKQMMTGVKGVQFRDGKWRSRIQAYGKRECLGTFDTFDEAVASYREAAQQIHGEFARL